MEGPPLMGVPMQAAPGPPVEQVSAVCPYHASLHTRHLPEGFNNMSHRHRRQRTFSPDGAAYVAIIPPSPSSLGRGLISTSTAASEGWSSPMGV
jgi:hypothetical protein